MTALPDAIVPSFRHCHTVTDRRTDRQKCHNNIALCMLCRMLTRDDKKLISYRWQTAPRICATYNGVVDPPKNTPCPYLLLRQIWSFL